jgi:hypothetical protein
MSGCLENERLNTDYPSKLGEKAPVALGVGGIELVWLLWGAM